MISIKLFAVSYYSEHHDWHLMFFLSFVLDERKRKGFMRSLSQSCSHSSFYKTGSIINLIHKMLSCWNETYKPTACLLASFTPREKILISKEAETVSRSDSVEIKETMEGKMYDLFKLCVA